MTPTLPPVRRHRVHLPGARTGWAILLAGGLWPALVACRPATPALGAGFADDFERATLGPRWRPAGGDWQVLDGAVRSRAARNAPLWLDLSLPRDVELRLTAWSASPAVDLKFEIFGDGEQHQSGYVLILAGWRNSTSIIARLDEHGRERTPALDAQLQAEVAADPAAAAAAHRGLRERLSRPARMQPGTRYALRLVRQGHWLRFYVDEQLHLEYFDPSPLAGPGHDRFALNNWESEVAYDDLQIRPL